MKVIKLKSKAILNHVSRSYDNKFELDGWTNIDLHFLSLELGAWSQKGHIIGEKDISYFANRKIEN